MSLDAPLIAASAHKHGVRDYDQAGNLLEVGDIDSSDGPIIIHAMPARPKYLR